MEPKQNQNIVKFELKRGVCEASAELYLPCLSGSRCLQLPRNLGDGPFLCAHLPRGKVDSKLRWRGVGSVSFRRCFVHLRDFFKGIIRRFLCAHLPQHTAWGFHSVLKTACLALGQGAVSKRCRGSSSSSCACLGGVC